MGTRIAFDPIALDDAPEEVEFLLEKVTNNLGFVPNLVAKMANGPSLLHGYLAADGALAKGTLKAQERQLVLLTASVENGSEYSIAAHATIARRLGVDPEMIDAIRRNEPLKDARLEALVALTREMVRQRGHLSDGTVLVFLLAGYRKEQILEVILAVAIKTISSYLDHLSPTELDKPFQAEQTFVSSN